MAKISEKKTYNREGKLFSHSVTNLSDKKTTTQYFDTRSAEDIKVDNFKRNETLKKMYRSQISAVGGVIKMIFIILMLIYLFNLFQGRIVLPSFTSLLNNLGNAPRLDVHIGSGVIPKNPIEVMIFDVNIFGWLNVVWLPLIDILNFIIFLMSCLINVVTFVLWFVPTFFGL